MFECDLKPYCNEDCDKCEYKEEQLQRETLAAEVEELRKALWELVKPVADLVTRAANLAEALKDYDNRRVVHLAAHSKKKRIRNKNQNRIMKWIGKGGKDNGRKANVHEEDH